jgi:hypothetical protein
MRINYDAWLEKPYQDQYEAEEQWERAEQKFLDNDYAQYLDEWLVDNPNKTEEDYKESKEYIAHVNHVAKTIDDPWDGYDEWLRSNPDSY